MAIEGAVEPNLPTWETHIAAGYNPNNLSEEHPVIAVWHAQVADSGIPRIAYALARKNHLGVMEWQQEGLIPVNPPYTKSFDPVIAFNSVTGDFLVAACVNDPVLSTDRLAWSRYFPARAPFSQGWKHTDAWPHADKPWIVAGQMDASQQEFYTVITSAGCARWLRTTTGGLNAAGELDPAAWQSGTISETACNFALVATSPAALNKAFVSTIQQSQVPGTPSVFRFFEGTDSAGSTVEFAPFMISPTQQLQITSHASAVYSAGGNDQTYLPIPHNQSKRIYLWPNIAVDPVDANIVYLIYHDTVNPNPPLVVPPGGDEKVDVFFVKLTKSGSVWTPSAPVAIPDSDPTNPPPLSPSDNFHAAIYVTPGPSATSATTRIHVVFYSDRRYPGQLDTRGTGLSPSNLNLDAKFNAYYKYSDNGGTTWQPDQEIIQVPDEPAVDFAISPAPGFDLNDYVGLTARPVQNGYEVWTSFMGSRDLDTDHHPSVIHASRIPWPN